MDRQIAVYMFNNTVVFFTRSVCRVNMNCSPGKIAQMMQELVLHLPGNLMSSFNGEVRTHGYVYLCM